MNTIKYFITLLVLVISNVAFADTILFDDFEDTPSFTKNVPWNAPFGVDMRYTGFEDGTQTPGVKDVDSMTGHKSFGIGNAKATYPRTGQVSIQYRLPTGYTSRKVSFWYKVTVDSLGEVRVNLDNRLINWTGFTNTYTNTPKTEGWKHFETNLPDGGTLLSIEVYGRNELPQKTDPRLSNAFIDRVEVVSGASDIPLLSKEEAKLELDSICQPALGCPLPNDYSACTTALLDGMQAQGRLKTEDLISLQTDIDSMSIYCFGYLDGFSSVDLNVSCTPFYDRGVLAGVASVDAEVIRQAGFAAGVASVDVAGIQQTSFAAGVASVDTLSIQNSAFAAGIASVDVVGLQQDAFKAGAASVDVEAIKDRSYQEGFGAGKDSVPACPPTVDPTAVPTPAKANLCSIGATEILNYKVGAGVRNAVVDPKRKNANLALGLPQYNDTYNFVTLGRGGMIELGFNGKAVYDQDGVDFFIAETSFSQRNKSCASYPEMAEIAVTQDGTTWKSLGTVCRDAAIDIKAAGLEYVVAVRITDKTTLASTDGYDVDGITCKSPAVKK